MKWIRLWSAVAATVGLSAAAQADLGCLSGNNGCGKSCSCASDCQPVCCKPTIQIPCEPTVHTYQRQHAAAKPPCCNTCPAPKSCLFKKKSCNTCAAPVCSAPATCNTCTTAPATCNTCATAPATCSTCNTAPACDTCNTCNSGKKCSLFGSMKNFFGKNNNCCEVKCCNADPCEIAQLIYESQTACYAKQRSKALCKLGKFDCSCNPEIMGAFIYGLNDADERVRRQAADEIGDQLEDHPCCCSPEVIAALTCALGDCDKCVVRQAKEALQECGYDVVQACCEQPACKSGCSKGSCLTKSNCKQSCSTCKQTCCVCKPVCTTTCATGCANGSCGVAPGAAPAPTGTAPAPAPLPADAAPAPGAAPAPAPPADPQTYYVPVRPQQKRNSLAGLLGLAN